MLMKPYESMKGVFIGLDEFALDDSSVYIDANVLPLLPGTVKANIFARLIFRALLILNCFACF